MTHPRTRHQPHQPHQPRPFIVGFALPAAFVLVSCATPDPPAPAASKAPSASASTSAGRRIDITVTGKKVKPDPATVNLAVGESLTIALTSDRDNTLHAHGFEIAKTLKAGQRAEVTIKGAQPGVFEFELHDPELRLFQVAVR